MKTCCISGPAKTVRQRWVLRQTWWPDPISTFWWVKYRLCTTYESACIMNCVMAGDLLLTSWAWPWSCQILVLHKNGTLSVCHNIHIIYFMPSFYSHHIDERILFIKAFLQINCNKLYAGINLLPDYSSIWQLQRTLLSIYCWPDNFSWINLPCSKGEKHE